MVDGVGRSPAGAVARAASGFGNACSRNASSNASRVANAAWDIRPMLWWESLVARVSPRVRPGIRTSASCLRSQTTQSGIDAGEFGSGVGSAMADADTGPAAGVAVVAGVGWMYT